MTTNEIEALRNLPNRATERPLPDGWRWTTIGEVAKTTSGGTPSRKRPDYYGGSIPWVKSGELGDSIVSSVQETITVEALKDSSAKIFPKGTALVALYGATVGKTGILGIDAATNQAVCAIFPEDGLFTAKYMTYWLRSQRNTLIGLSSGGAQPNISQTIVKAFPFPLAPPAEQERIVAEIEKQFTRLDQAVASLRRLQGGLARYKASVLKAACEGRLVPQDSNDEPATSLLSRILAERRAQWQAANPGKKYKEVAGVETAGLPDLPEGWVWTDMQTLTIDGPTNGLYLPKSKYGSGIPILRIDDYQDGESRSSEELRKVEADQKEIEKYSLRKRDMVINRVNSPSHLGKCIIIEDRNLPSLFESNMMRIGLSANVNPYFVQFYLQSGNGRARLISNAKWAVNQASINQGDVGITPVPLPPLAEQECIVAEVERRLSVVTVTEQAISANLSRAERLRQSILHRAFNGRLVPQESDAAQAQAITANSISTERQRITV